MTLLICEQRKEVIELIENVSNNSFVDTDL